MSNASPSGEASNPIMEALTHLTKQIAEMSGRMGGMEERLVRVERGKSLQIENEEMRRASVQSTTITPGQAHELCYPPPHQTRNFQQPTFQTNNTPNFPRQPTPYPHPQPYHPPQENRFLVDDQVRNQTPIRNTSNASIHDPHISPPQNAPQMPYQDYQYQNPLYDEMNDELNNDEFWEHGGRGGYGVPREGFRPRELRWAQGMEGQEYGNRGDRMGNRGDRMGYRGDRMGVRG